MVTRRNVIKLGAAGAMTAATGLAPAILKGATQEPLRISAFGGFFENAFKNSVAKAFTEQTGVPIETTSQGAGDDWLFGLVRATRNGLAPVDLTILLTYQMMRCMDIGGVLQPFRGNMMPNLTNNIPSTFLFKDQEQLWGAGVMSWYQTLAINTNEVKEPPTSWADIFEKDMYRGKIGLPGFYNGGMIETVAKTYFGGNDILYESGGLDEVLKKTASIKPQVKFWWSAESQMEQALRNEEVISGAYFHDVATLMGQEGYPVKSIFPKEGGFIGIGHLAMLSTSKKSDLCHAFVNFCAKPEIQATFAREMQLSPTMPFENTGLTEEEFAKVGSKIEPVFPAARLMVDKATLVQRKWQRMITTG